MPKWIVRYDVAYSIEVEAETEDEAIRKAANSHTDEWSRADSKYDAEKQGE